MRNLRIGLASKQALNERRGFDELVCPRKPRCLEHHVIHIDSFLLLGSEQDWTVLVRVEVLFACTFLRHRILSARAALTSGLACNAPSTTTEAMEARASSGVTSAAIAARPNTLIPSTCRARRACSRSSRLKFRRPRSRLFRAVDCLTASAWRSSWFRIAVRMKSVRLE